LSCWQTVPRSGNKSHSCRTTSLRVVTEKFPAQRALHGIDRGKISRTVGEGWRMFDIERFVCDCKDALRQDQSQSIVRDVVAQAISDPATALKALGEPQRGGIQTLYRADDLTILNVIWAPWMTLLPHNHQMWAVIGIYTGREDNIFWRRVQDCKGAKVEAAGAKALGVKDAVPLGHDVIHSVTNPIPRLTGAIHVYGGDFFGPVGRSEWDAETLLEQSCDGARMARRFEEANAYSRKT
jgi:predicted metal-dependent enzyme (double-stranded beta helix superfamily)